ncbi:MAG: radical SAM protein [Endomicrobiales bacterium]|nr:radical SAM protein [Endomicrobiales bacterium]
MKVALVKCPWWVRYCPPYILAFLAALLRQNNHEAFCFDLNNSMYHEAGKEYKKYWDDRDYYSVWEDNSFIAKLSEELELNKFADKILHNQPDVVCFDTHTPSVLFSYDIAKRIKRKNSEVKIVFMGHKASRAQMAYDFIEQDFVDYVCPGEIDIVLLDLLKLLEKNPKTLPECRGFLVKRSEKIIDCGNPGIPKDLDSLPFPDYSDFRTDIENKLYSQPERLDILDSRGCVNACHFCYERLFWQKYRTMSGKRMYGQIQYHIKDFPQINYFYFNGLLLNGNLKNLEEFCDLVIKNKLKIKWAGQAMINRDMTKNVLDKMARAGCVWLGYGIESGSQKVLNEMNKKYSIKDAPDVLKNTHDAGINVQINIMFGFPTEKEEDFKETLSFLKKIRPYIDNVLASQSFFTLEKETYVKKCPEKFGIENSGHHLFWKSDNGKNNYAERFRRYEEFCNLALKLGIPETSGVLKEKPDKWLLLGEYYRFEKDYDKVKECEEKSSKNESINKTT